MPRNPKPHRTAVITLLALTFLLPALAIAQPHPREAVRAPAERYESAPSLLAQLQSLLSALWKTGSILDPDGLPSPNPPATTAGDTGSGLEPDGRH